MLALGAFPIINYSAILFFHVAFKWAFLSRTYLIREFLFCVVLPIASNYFPLAWNSTNFLHLNFVQIDSWSVLRFESSDFIEEIFIITNDDFLALRLANKSQTISSKNPPLFIVLADLIITKPIFTCQLIHPSIGSIYLQTLNWSILGGLVILYWFRYPWS